MRLACCARAKHAGKQVSCITGGGDGIVLGVLDMRECRLCSDRGSEWVTKKQAKLFDRRLKNRVGPDPADVRLALRELQSFRPWTRAQQHHRGLRANRVVMGTCSLPACIASVVIKDSSCLYRDRPSPSETMPNP